MQWSRVRKTEEFSTLKIFVIVKCTFVCVFPFGSESERQPLEVILAMDTSPCRRVL